jgi:hypothetical protein
MDAEIQEIRHAYKISATKSHEKRSLGGLKNRQEDGT